MNSTRPSPTESYDRVPSALTADPSVTADPRRTRVRTTLVEEIYHAVRSDLLAAHYEPGQWVKVADIQRRFGCSLSAIREALSRLVAEGLLVTVANRGFRVVTLSLEDLKDLTEARIAIETIVLRESVVADAPGWKKRLTSAYHSLRGIAPNNEPPGTLRMSPSFIPLHAEFHEALISGCPNRRLRLVATSLRYSSELYRMWRPRTAIMSLAESEEHGDLFRLAMNGDAAACVDLLARHIEGTLRALT